MGNIQSSSEESSNLKKAKIIMAITRHLSVIFRWKKVTLDYVEEVMKVQRT
jgi:hypothetical protein